MILVQSCKKNMYKFDEIRKYKWWPLNLFFIIGEPSLHTDYIIEGDIITVKCADNYDELTSKTNLGVRAVYQTYDPAFIVKIDDDMIPNIDLLFNVVPLSCEYAGNYINIEPHVADYMNNKFEYPENQKDQYIIRHFEYCPGGSYYLGKKAIKLIAENTIPYYTKYDDMNVGIFLNQNGIIPVESEIGFSDNIEKFNNCEKIFYNNGQ